MTRAPYFAGIAPELVASFIERRPLGDNVPRDLARWKRLARAGWSVVVLEDTGAGELVAFGCCYDVDDALGIPAGEQLTLIA